MTESIERTGSSKSNLWRIARWTAALLLLLLPLVMMQFSDEWNWNIGGFLAAGIMIGGVGLLYELAERASTSRAYRAGVAIALGASFLTIWTTIVRDDENGVGFLLLVMAAGASSFAAHFRAAGMARAMFGIAVMEMLLGMLIATAPSTATLPFGPTQYLVYCGFFAFLWLSSAGLFRAAARNG